MQWKFLTAVTAGVVLASPGAVAGQAAAPARGDSLRLNVDGMVCSVCARAVERRLGKLEQVEQVRVSLDSGLVVVLLRQGVTVSDSTLSHEVRRAGFALRGVRRFKREPAGR